MADERKCLGADKPPCLTCAYYMTAGKLIPGDITCPHLLLPARDEDAGDDDTEEDAP